MSILTVLAMTPRSSNRSRPCCLSVRDNGGSSKESFIHARNSGNSQHGHFHAPEIHWSTYWGAPQIIAHIFPEKVLGSMGIEKWRTSSARSSSLAALEAFRAGQGRFQQLGWRFPEETLMKSLVRLNLLRLKLGCIEGQQFIYFLEGL